jgi:hypothetical protein
LEFFHRVVLLQNATFRKPFVHLTPGKIKVFEHALLCPLDGVIPTSYSLIKTNAKHVVCFRNYVLPDDRNRGSFCKGVWFKKRVTQEMHYTVGPFYFVTFHISSFSKIRTVNF